MSRHAAMADEEDPAMLVFENMSPEDTRKFLANLPRSERARAALTLQRMQARRLVVRMLETDDSQPADRLDLLRQLSKAVSPAHDQPAELLQKDTACAVAATMRTVDPEALGADAVPLVVALMQYEWAIADQGEIGVILGACYPHAVATLQWARTAHTQTLQSGSFPSAHHLRAQRALARLCAMVARHLTLSREERKRQVRIEPVQRLPPAEAVAFDAACLAAQTAATARRLLRPEPHAANPEEVLGARAVAMRAKIALQATENALTALRHAHKTAKRFPQAASRPAAAAFCSLLAILGASQGAAPYKTLSENASLLTEVAGGLPRGHARKLEADAMAAAAAALAQAEAAERLGLDSPDPQHQQYTLLCSALPRVVATAETLAAFSRGVPPTLERLNMLARLLWWAVQLQHCQRMLLLQPPGIVFQEWHRDARGTRKELLCDQVLSVAGAAAHGIAAGTQMAIGASLSSRQHAMTAAGSSSGKATLQPWTADAQLAAVVPAISMLVNAQMPCDWGIWPHDGAWAAANALVTLAGFVADALADATGTAAASNTAAAADIKAESAEGAAVADGMAAAGPSAAGSGNRSSTTATACHAAGPRTQQVNRAWTQPVPAELLRSASDSAIVATMWANSVVESVLRSMPANDKGTDRLGSLEAQLRAARLAAAAAGAVADMARSAAGRTALLERQAYVVPSVLQSLVWGLTVKGMHQGSAAAAELAALMRNVATTLPDFLLPPDGNTDVVRSWHKEAASAQKQHRGALSAELLRAVSAVSGAVEGVCGSFGSDGMAAAAQLEAEAAANAAADALLQEEADVAVASPSRSRRKGKGKKG